MIVNRVWQHHFGEGIVRSPDNFGKLGDRVFASPITFLSRSKQLVTIPIGDILIAFGLE